MQAIIYPQAFIVNSTFPVFEIIDDLNTINSSIVFVKVYCASESFASALFWFAAVYWLSYTTKAAQTVRKC